MVVCRSGGPHTRGTSGGRKGSDRAWGFGSRWNVAGGCLACRRWTHLLRADDTVAYCGLVTCAACTVAPAGVVSSPPRYKPGTRKPSSSGDYQVHHGGPVMYNEECPRTGCCERIWVHNLKLYMSILVFLFGLLTV
ncbi:hypothetical protein PVAP13_6KG343900 [Panicum virgatum]|uniref:Uncharacterized protein n=1 Tax=Panicum virgatum TaxID=38727 RepID=A0A8T0RIF5_PANVG|nr:hypothetical protein PVAP13_6KG343900 [Panicum virgatum]KAG2584820.1 hypothetical protein PVAP13_6KG343900 [Panicum virgatum]KAG2584822.1 hypothetical protein PVAP13_6KG343900 [Panicum virgatum]